MILLRLILERGNTLKESDNNNGFYIYIVNWVNKNPGKAVGIILGFIAGILFFVLGIYKTLLVLLLILIGYYLGRSRDDNISIFEKLSNLFGKKD